MLLLALVMTGLFSVLVYGKMQAADIAAKRAAVAQQQTVAMAKEVSQQAEEVVKQAEVAEIKTEVVEAFQGQRQAIVEVSKKVARDFTKHKVKRPTTTAQPVSPKLTVVQQQSFVLESESLLKGLTAVYCVSEDPQGTTPECRI